MTGTDFVSAIKSTIKGLISQIKAIGIAAGALAGAFAVISLFTAHPLATFLRLVSWAGVIMMLLGAAVMILTFKRARDVVPAALLASLTAALIATFISLAFVRFLPPGGWMLIAVLAGAAIGAVWSRTTLLFVDERRLRIKGTIWYLAVWALTLALNQGVAIVTGRTPMTTILLALAGAGIACGNTLGLILRTRKAAALLRPARSEHHV